MFKTKKFIITLLVLLGFMISGYIINISPAFSQPEPNCVCAECGYKCGSGHAQSCSAYQRKSTNSGGGGSGGYSLNSEQYLRQQVTLGIAQAFMQGMINASQANERRRQLEEIQKIKEEEERKIALQKEWKELRGELMGVNSDEDELAEMMGVNSTPGSCVKGDPIVWRPCILNDSPCCPPYQCKGKFPNTYCVLPGTKTDKLVNKPRR